MDDDTPESPKKPQQPQIGLLAKFMASRMEDANKNNPAADEGVTRVDSTHALAQRVETQSRKIIEKMESITSTMVENGEVIRRVDTGVDEIRFRSRRIEVAVNRLLQLQQNGAGGGVGSRFGMGAGGSDSDEKNKNSGSGIPWGTILGGLGVGGAGAGTAAAARKLYQRHKASRAAKSAQALKKSGPTASSRTNRIAQRMGPAGKKTAAGIAQRLAQRAPGIAARLAGRAALGLGGPVGWALLGGSLAYEAYSFFQDSNEKEADQQAAPQERQDALEFKSLKDIEFKATTGEIKFKARKIVFEGEIEGLGNATNQGTPRPKPAPKIPTEAAPPGGSGGYPAGPAGGGLGQYPGGAARMGRRNQHGGGSSGGSSSGGSSGGGSSGGAEKTKPADSAPAFRSEGAPKSWPQEGGVDKIPSAGGTDKPSSKIPPGFGSLSEKYESGGKGVGMISSGYGDPGGVSYGKHQLSTKDSMPAFLRSPEGKDWANHFQGLQPGTQKFNEVYSRLARENPEAFANSQQAFLKRTHFDPLEKHAKELGFDTSNPGVREALYSMSVQHGGAKKIVSDAAANKGSNPQDQIKALYGSRSQYVAGLSSLPEGTKQSVLNRYTREEKDALGLSTQPSPDKPETEKIKTIDDLVAQEKNAPAVQAQPQGEGGKPHTKMEVPTEVNKNRPNYIKGTVTMGGEEYRFGSGQPRVTGGDMGRGSAPYGEFEIKPGLHRGSNPSFRDNSFYVKDMFDPKWNTNRSAILFHSARDVDKMYTAGCFGIDKKQWPKFREHMLSEMKKHGTLVVRLNPDGNAQVIPKSQLSSVDKMRETPQSSDDFIRKGGSVIEGLMPTQPKIASNALGQGPFDFFKRPEIDSDSPDAAKAETDSGSPDAAKAEIDSDSPDAAKENKEEPLPNLSLLNLKDTETSTGPSDVIDLRQAVKMDEMKSRGLRMTEEAAQKATQSYGDLGMTEAKRQMIMPFMPKNMTPMPANPPSPVPAIVPTVEPQQVIPNVTSPNYGVRPSEANGIQRQGQTTEDVHAHLSRVDPMYDTPEYAPPVVPTTTKNVGGATGEQIKGAPAS
jgi:hypothetical protein